MLASDAATPHTVTIEAPRSAAAATYLRVPSTIFMSAMIFRSGNAAAIVRTDPIPVNRIRGVPTSSQSTPARIAIRADGEGLIH